MPAPESFLWRINFLWRWRVTGWVDGILPKYGWQKIDNRARVRDRKHGMRCFLCLFFVLLFAGISGVAVTAASDAG